MIFANKGDKLWDVLENIASDEGLQVYDVERVGDNSLKVVVKKAGGQNSDETQAGVTSQDCARLCKRLRVYFAVEGTNFGLGLEPGIEVSSPGINRNLRTIQQFEESVGERVKILPQKGLEVQGPIVGVLSNVSNETLDIKVEARDEIIALPINDIKKAHVDFIF